MAASQKEVGNNLGRREWSGNGVEEASSGMCVGGSGGLVLF